MTTPNTSDRMLHGLSHRAKNSIYYALDKHNISLLVGTPQVQNSTKLGTVLFWWVNGLSSFQLLTVTRLVEKAEHASV